MPNPGFNVNTEMTDSRSDYNPYGGGYTYRRPFNDEYYNNYNPNSSSGNIFERVWDKISQFTDKYGPLSNGYYPVGYGVGVDLDKHKDFTSMNGALTGAINGSHPQYNVQTGNSAQVVNSSSPEYDMDAAFGAMTSAVDEAYRMAEFNNAFEREQAENMMNFQREMNQKAMEFNAAEAAKSRDWSKMMSDTAHVREIADLKAAGLNPVLSASGGNGAWAGSGAAASGVTSAGAKASADTSATTAALDAAIAMAGLKNQYRIAQLNSATTLQAKAMSMSGSTSYAEKKAIDFEYWLKQQDAKNSADLQNDLLGGTAKVVAAVVPAIIKALA